MKNVFTIFLCCATIASFSQELKKRQVTAAQIDAVFAQWNTPDKAGIAVGVLNDGNIVHAKGYGLANLEHQIPISSKTKFHIGDLAKEFTVYALLLLEHRGQLSLQDDIRKYLPKLTSFPNSISIEQLIHHTSGLNNDEVAKALAGWRAEDVFTKEQAYTMIWNQAKTAPHGGSKQQPTDAGFMLLEDLVAQLTKMPYADFVTKEIFQPLEMTNSVFDVNGAVIANKAQGYFKHNEGFANATMNSSHTLLSDLYTTVEDMCLWAKELRDPKIGTKQMVAKFEGLSVVDAKKVKEVNTALYAGGHRFWDFRGTKKLYHIEVAFGYASKLIRYPDHDLAVIVLGNDGAYNGYAATGASALYVEDFLDPMPAATTNINSKKLSQKQLETFTGDYWDVANHTTRKIYVANDTLRYFRGEGNESALVPLSKNSFKMMTYGEVTVNFDLDATPKTMAVKVGDDISNLVAYEHNSSWAKNLSTYVGNYYAPVLNTTYRLQIENDKLVLKHPRLASIELQARTPEVFTGNQRHFSSLTFKRGAKETIKGFHLASSGITDIWFQKETNATTHLVKAK